MSGCAKLSNETPLFWANSITTRLAILSPLQKLPRGLCSDPFRHAKDPQVDLQTLQNYRYR